MWYRVQRRAYDEGSQVLGPSRWAVGPTNQGPAVETPPNRDARAAQRRGVGSATWADLGLIFRPNPAQWAAPAPSQPPWPGQLQLQVVAVRVAVRVGRRARLQLDVRARRRAEDATGACADRHLPAAGEEDGAPGGRL